LKVGEQRGEVLEGETGRAKITDTEWRQKGRIGHMENERGAPT
jgi:hypothetical protein